MPGKQGRLTTPRIKKCGPCGNDFESFSGAQKFCSPACRLTIHLPNRHDHIIKCMYGITEQEYLAMCDAQGNVCAICKSPDNGSVASRYWFIDHDHVTKEIRGLLCNHCNQGLGKFMDDPELMRASAIYIETCTRRPIEKWVRKYK